ncbi:MAG: S8 family serine peptidase [Gemmatimonadota bacterium]
MSRIAAALAALLLTAGPTMAQEAARVDPTLRFLLMTRERLGAPPPPPAREAPRPDAMAPPRPGLLESALDRSAGPAGPVRVRTLVRVGPGGVTALERAGALIGARVGDIVTARIPLDALPGLMTAPGIRSLEAATALSPLGFLAPREVGSSATLGSNVAPAVAGTPPPPAAPPLDSASADAGFDALRRRVGERWEGLTGSGVIVGIYDSGLDLTHDDFLTPDGRSRVLFAWDQMDSVSGGPAPGTVGEHTFGYGTECTAATIDADCPLRDVVGHGTHVAGIAVADGSATGQGQPAWRFPGGAPGADLIVVKGGDGAFTSDLLLDGVAYIFARAGALGRPAVINLSLTGQQGPRDGTTLLEQALDALSGPGRIIVAGAGNAGDFRNGSSVPQNGPYHAQGRAGLRAHGLRVPAYEPNDRVEDDIALMELWYDGADSLAITVRTPDRSAAVTVETGDSALLETPSGAVVVLNAVDGPWPGNGDHGALIGIVDTDAAFPPAEGVWAIEVTPTAVHANGDYHLWLNGHTFRGGLAHLEGGTTNRYLVGVPATADRVLAAGAHVSRHRWLGVGGTPQELTGQEPLGDIAFFSSPGPRRDGVQKPDLTAPGKVVISALSKDATLWDPPELQVLVEADSVHVGSLGTSMAAPQLAAAVAVLLQLDPELTPEEARNAVALSAATDAFVADRLPSPAWGSGKLDAAAAAERLRPAGLGGADEPVTLSSNPVRSDVLVIGYADPPRSVAVYTLVGERVRTFDAAEIGPLTTVWPLDTDAGGEVANGAYALVVELPGRRVVKKILVARP